MLTQLLPIRNIFVPHFGRMPWVAGLERSVALAKRLAGIEEEIPEPERKK